MAKRYLHLSDILKTRWLMHEQFAVAFYPTVINLLNGGGQIKGMDDEEGEANPIIQNAVIAGSNVFFISEYGEAAPPEQAPKNSIAVLGIKGAITKYDQFCGGAGIETKAALFDRAMDNPNINGLILDVDSGGGDANATEFFAEKIKNAKKPVVALVTGMAASAAFWIASAADKIILNGKISEVGSIGTYIQIADFTEFYKEKGINIIREYAPQSTEKNKAFEDLLKGDNKAMKEDLKQFTDFFINAVKENRSGKLGNDAGIFKGKMYFTEDAIAEGLADQMGNMDDAVNAINELKTQTGTSTTQINNMKLMISKNMAAVASVFNLQFADGATEQEVDLTAEQLISINQALVDANKKSSDLQTKVTSLEGKQTELQTEVDRLKAFEPAGTTAEKSKEASTSEQGETEAYDSVKYANEKLK
jgi:signal peptide peptidase SppA